MSEYIECANYRNCGDYAVEGGDYCETCYHEYEQDKPLPNSTVKTKELQQRITSLEQQLKTAKESYADIGNYDIPMPDDIKGRFQAELFYRGAYAMRDKIIIEYANNLEGK